MGAHFGLAGKIVVCLACYLSVTTPPCRDKLGKSCQELRSLGLSPRTERATLEQSLQPELGVLLPKALLTRERIELVLVQLRPE